MKTPTPSRLYYKGIIPMWVPVSDAGPLYFIVPCLKNTKGPLNSKFVRTSAVLIGIGPRNHIKYKGGGFVVGIEALSSR